MAAKIVGKFSGFEADLAALEAQVKNAALHAGTILQEDMRACLTEHIVEDVYDAYDPDYYTRRLSDGGLLDIPKNTAGSPLPSVSGNGVEIEIQYEPDGATDGLGNAINLHVDGDDLINRIEKKDPHYNWNVDERSIPERPFFRNFVEEMIGGRAEKTMVFGMNAADPALGVAADGGMVRESEDWH